MASLYCFYKMVRREGLEPSQRILETLVLPITPPTYKFGAVSEIQTHDLNLGMVAHYQAVLLLLNSSPQRSQALLLIAKRSCAEELDLERNKGIKPFSLAWKARAQSIYQSRILCIYYLPDSTSTND